MISLEKTFSPLASVVACSCPCQVEASCLPDHIHISMYTYYSVVVCSARAGETHKCHL